METMTFGERVSYARNLREMGVNELSRLVGFSVTRYETGNRGTKRIDHNVVKALAKALRVRYEWLADEEGDLDDKGTPAPRHSVKDDAKTTIATFPGRWSPKVLALADERVTKLHRSGKPDHHLPEGGWKELLDQMQHTVDPDWRKAGGHRKMATVKHK